MAARKSASQMTASLMMRRKKCAGLFFPILTGHSEKMIKSGPDAVQREDDQQVGCRVQPTVEKVSDRHADGNGSREHQPDDRKIDPVLVSFRYGVHRRGKIRVAIAGLNSPRPLRRL